MYFFSSDSYKYTYTSTTIYSQYIHSFTFMLRVHYAVILENRLHCYIRMCRSSMGQYRILNFLLFSSPFYTGSRNFFFFLVDSPLRILAPQPLGFVVKRTITFFLKFIFKKFIFPQWTTPYPPPLLVDLFFSVFLCLFPFICLFLYVGFSLFEIFQKKSRSKSHISYQNLISRNFENTHETSYFYLET